MSDIMDIMYDLHQITDTNNPSNNYNKFPGDTL